MGGLSLNSACTCTLGSDLEPSEIICVDVGWQPYTVSLKSCRPRPPAPARPLPLSPFLCCLLHARGRPVWAEPWRIFKIGIVRCLWIHFYVEMELSSEESSEQFTETEPLSEGYDTQEQTQSEPDCWGRLYPLKNSLDAIGRLSDN